MLLLLFLLHVRSSLVKCTQIAHVVGSRNYFQVQITQKAKQGKAYLGQKNPS